MAEAASHFRVQTNASQPDTRLLGFHFHAYPKAFSGERQEQMGQVYWSLSEQGIKQRLWPFVTSIFVNQALLDSYFSCIYHYLQTLEKSSLQNPQIALSILLKEFVL